GELECVETLFRHGAQVNARADVINGIGGQTPIFHAIASPQPDTNIAALDYLLNKSDKWIDLSQKATFERFWVKQETPITVIEFAEREAKGNETRELSLLRRMNRPRVEETNFKAAV